MKVKKIRIWKDTRKGEERLWLSYGKECLSGPWKTPKEAQKARNELVFGERV